MPMNYNKLWKLLIDRGMLRVSSNAVRAMVAITVKKKHPAGKKGKHPLPTGHRDFATNHLYRYAHVQE